MFVSKKEFDSQINKAFIQGYNQGVEAGKQEMFFKNVTPNMLREFLNLPPLNKENKEKAGV